MAHGLPQIPEPEIDFMYKSIRSLLMDKGVARLIDGDTLSSAPHYAIYSLSYEQMQDQVIVNISNYTVWSIYDTPNVEVTHGHSGS